jgi:hypothetical protein
MRKLTIPQQKKIYKEIVLDKLNRVVLLDVSTEKDFSKKENTENVYLIDNDNNIIWQVKTSNERFKDDMFVAIKRSENGDLIAKRFSGFKYKVDLNTGSTEEIGWEK